jgi:hypothetical protein
VLREDLTAVSLAVRATHRQPQRRIRRGFTGDRPCCVIAPMIPIFKDRRSALPHYVRLVEKSKDGARDIFEQ